MYYKLLQDNEPNRGYLSTINNEDLILQTGNVLPKDEINSLVLPWTFNLNSGNQELSLGDFYPNVMLMSKKLVDILQSVGVDNLQLFEADVINEKTGKKIKNYYAVNIVGLVSCVAEDQSTSTPLADVEYISDLVIDPARAKDFNMFLLAETRMDWIVSEKVAIAIKAGNLSGVELKPINEIGP